MKGKTLRGSLWGLILCGADSVKRFLKFVLYTIPLWLTFHLGFLCTKWKLNFVKSAKAWWKGGKEDRKELWDWVVVNPVAVLGLVSGFIALSLVPFCIYDWTSWWWVIILGTVAIICFLIVYDILGSALHHLVYLISWALHKFFGLLGKTLGTIFTDRSLGAYLLGIVIAMILCVIGEVVSTQPIKLYLYSAGIILGLTSALYLVYHCKTATTATPTKGKWALAGLGAVMFGIPLVLFAVGLIGMYNPYFLYLGIGGLFLIIGAATFAIKDSTI